jgi:hypothetical protein
LRCRHCRHEWLVERQTPAVGPATADYDPRQYLQLPFAWVPSGRFGHGKVHEYRLDLGANDVAILRLVADKGWALTIARGAAQPEIDKGLFATPYDALMVIVAEYGGIEAKAAS